MQIYLNTTIQELFDGGYISVRTYNSLRYADMVTLEDVLNYADSPMELMKLKNFGRKSCTEIEPLLKEVQSVKRHKNPPTPEEMFSLVGYIIGGILREAYNTLFVEENYVANFFKSCYPSVEVLHDKVISNEKNLLEIHGEFSMAENVDFRKMFARYLEEAIRRMQDNQYTGNEIYRKLMLSDKN